MVRVDARRRHWLLTAIGTSIGAVVLSGCAIQAAPKAVPFLSTIADLESQTRTLFDAVISNEIGRVATLLREGVDVDSQTRNGHTPLIVAALLGHDQICALLLRAGANPNSSAVVVSFSAGTVIEQRTLLGGRQPALHFAVQGGNGRIVEMLIRAGANVNAVDSRQYWAWLYAMDPGSISALVKAGIDPDAPLFGTYAAKVPKPEDLIVKAMGGGVPRKIHVLVGADPPETALKVLLDLGADPNIRGFNGQSALELAVRKRSYETMKFLLDAGADPNGLGDGNFTPLMIALVNGDVIATELLLERGANPDLELPRGRDGKSWTSRKLVVEGGEQYTSVREVFERRGLVPLTQVRPQSH